MGDVGRDKRICKLVYIWMWVVSSYALVAKVLLEPTEYEVLWAAETSLHALEKGRNS
jgi:hypothetical protein